MQPVFVFTDASFSGGNNTPKECAAAVKAAGYPRILVADNDSVSALIQAYKHAESNQIGFVPGVTLTVSLLERDSVIWFFKHTDAIRAFFDALSEKQPEPKDAYTAYQDTKSRYEDDKLLKAKLAQTGMTVTAFKAIKKRIPDNMGSGNITLIAKNLSGYYKLLKITSIKAINKHHNINHPEKPSRLPYATWEQIKSELDDDLVAIDTLRDNSVLSAVLNNPNEAMLLDTLSDYLVHARIGLCSLSLFEHAIRLAKKPLIPLPLARYMSEAEEEEYRIKMAVHLKDKDIEGGKGTGKITIYDPGVPTPDKDTCLIPYAEWRSRLHSMENIDHAFWPGVENIKLPLGKVFLPNYDMNIMSVIAYAAQKEQVTLPEFNDEHEAVAWFSTWQQSFRPTKLPVAQFTQQRLNDYCLHQFATEGLARRLSDLPEGSEDVRETYQSRFDMEFTVIENMGFSGYFLIIYDVVNYARKVGVPVGDGRGSAAGSLVVYCLEVTDVDPIEYGLQFERFLNPERVSMPDIDVDFGDGIGVDRTSILRYISEKYQKEGTEHPSSSQIANINRYQLKAALSAVRGALGLSQYYDDYLKFIVKQVETSLGLKEEQAMPWDDFLSSDIVKGKLKREPIFAKIVMIAKNLSGKRSTFGVHAGGVVIAPTTITEHSAVECDDKGKYFCTYDKDDVEQAGLVKLDLLGLKTLSIVELAVKLIDETQGVKLDHRRLPKDEADVMKLICDQLLSDIFQLESPGMRDLVSKLQPQNIGEIGVLSALFRPGALQSGMVEDFVDVKFGKKPANYEHPALKKVTHDTYGCIVYQEQVMSIVRELAGYSLGEADLLRRAMGKKKIEEMLKQKSVYTYRAQEHWRDHYLDIGQQQDLAFSLDVNLNDCRDVFESLGFSSAINEHGYLALWDDVIPLLSYLLDWSEQDIGQFKQRINDMNYVVRLFKEHYHTQFFSHVPAKVEVKFPERAEAFTTRLYFAVSQMVRFNQIFNKVEKFAGYGFNKSHAIAYSIITYKAAYLKKRFPAAFFAAALTYKDLKLLHDTVTEAKAHFGIQLLTPHINHSQANFHPETEKSIRYGLSTLREMGNYAPVILQEREENGLYISLFDFICRLSERDKKPTTGVMASLSCSGAFDLFIPPSIKQSQINGREFIFWLRDLINQSAFLSTEKGGASLLHQQMHLLTPYEMHIYYTTLAKPGLLTKKGFPDDLVLARKNTKHLVADLFTEDAGVSTNDQESMSRAIESLFNKESGSCCAFELEYRKLHQALLGKKELLETCWKADITKSCSSSIIDTLNKERHYSGMYITSNPLKVLKVADLASREPPGTYINGYPVKVSDIDASFDRRPVSTYGIIRDVKLKTVKREDSNFFGEKMIMFKLEDGAYNISCMIFGSKACKQFLNKIVSEDTIALIGAEARFNNHGLTLSVKAMKRYFPTEDPLLHVVPSVDNRRR